MTLARRLALLLLLVAPRLEAATSEDVTGRIAVEVGKGRLVRLDRPAASVFVADPAVADVEVRSPTLLYLFGRGPGETSLFAVDRAERPVAALAVEVRFDEGLLKAALARAIPGGRFEIATANDALVLAGEVATAAEAADAARIAARFVPGGDRGRIINKLAVATPTQVNLRVRVIEVSREVTRALGFNWEAAGTAGDVTFGIATGNPVRGAAGLLTRNGGADSIFGAFAGRSVDVTGVVDALEKEGLVTVLAEPNLTALSGVPASFLAGGEYPIPVPQEGNVTTIEYRRFGVSLGFVATITDGGRIHLQVQPEVSQLSDAGALAFNGARIPSLTVRRVETAVDLASGQSFAIAGLIQRADAFELRKFPGLASIPVIGQLLRSRRFERDETELVVIVTPYLVRPTAPAELAGPAAPTRLQ
ncbi:type II and III secretion system protein family protein [Thermaurantiacus tibetensis]|uniref:type II and III secretion system protein family protein n=1 Tax=Thermaurantiacus tibetensis TaxID=2759035 RepID=UPI00188F966E|nr:type II and III secretion system protein family protein [Thermaurantiacus tibetensis]